MRGLETAFEVIVAGVVNKFKKLDNEIDLVPANQVAAAGQLSKLRNIAANRSIYDVIVFVDDDIIFPSSWMPRLLCFSKGKTWEVLGNRILLPDGGRYWDRAVISPHQMVDYDHPENDTNLYQCGCFWIMRRNIFQVEKWDESIPFYAEKSGGINEDIEYSRRLISKGHALSFDKENHVWHWDNRYTEWNTEAEGLRCMSKLDIRASFNVNQFPDVCEEFERQLDDLRLPI